MSTTATQGVRLQATKTSQKQTNNHQQQDGERRWGALRGGEGTVPHTHLSLYRVTEAGGWRREGVKADTCGEELVEGIQPTRVDAQELERKGGRRIRGLQEEREESDKTTNTAKAPTVKPIHSGSTNQLLSLAGCIREVVLLLRTQVNDFMYSAFDSVR